MKTATIYHTEDHAVVRTFCGSFSDMDHLQEELHAATKPWTKPAINIAETNSDYLLELALPGYKREELQVMIEDDVLTIRGYASCVPEQYEAVLRFYKKEFCVEAFARTFLLPEDAGVATACLKEGILFIHITKGTAQVWPVNGPCNTVIVPIN